MKNLAILLTFVTFLAAGVYGQSRQDALKKTINVFPTQVRIDTLLRIFSAQTGIGFSFNSKKISPSKMIAVTGRQFTLQQWLADLEQQIGIQHKWVGNHVVLIEPGNPTPSAKVTRSAQPPKTASLQKNSSLSSKQSGNPIVRSQPSTIPPEDLKKNESEAHLSDTIDKQLEATISYQSTDSSAPVADTTGKTLALSKQPDTVAALQPVTNTPVETKDAKGGLTNTRRKTRGLTPTDVYALTKLEAGPQGLDLSFERRLSRHSIVDINLGIGGGYAITGQDFNYKFGELSGPDIFVSVNPRFYYNRSKRFAQGKSLKANAGNYFGFRLKYVTDALAENFVVWDALLFNIHWGMQRPLGKRWVVNGHVGPGYGFAWTLFGSPKYFGLNHYYGSVELRICYLFNKNK